MTAKEYVRSKVPNARAERQVKGKIAGFKEVYWLIRDGGSNDYMASGKSESNAWKNAKVFVDEREM
jgi:hypothetical protein